MGEYTRKQHIASKTAGNEINFSAAKAGSIPNSSMEAIMAGRARASSEMMGHRQDLAPSLNAKMAKAFGMDLSNVQLYRSEAMSGTGTEGLASGNKIVLSADIDLNTTAGQAVLGHELSHVHAQNQGIGMGRSGLYQNAGLEHQADMEGMRAARGQSILGDSSGMDMGLGMGGIGGLTPLSAGMSASAGAPMQAKGKKKEEDTDFVKYGTSKNNQYKHSFWEALGVKNYATGIEFNKAANEGPEVADDNNPNAETEKDSVPIQSSPHLIHNATLTKAYGVSLPEKIALGAATPFLYLINRLKRLHSYDLKHRKSGQKRMKTDMDLASGIDSGPDDDDIVDEAMEDDDERFLENSMKQPLLPEDDK